jgi:hypothetical protein
METESSGKLSSVNMGFLKVEQILTMIMKIISQGEPYPLHSGCAGKLNCIICGRGTVTPEKKEEQYLPHTPFYLEGIE